MDAIFLIVGIVILAYIGAAFALLYAKEDYKKALVPGTVAWIITLVIYLIVVPETLIIFFLALMIGLVAQLVLPDVK